MSSPRRWHLLLLLVLSACYEGLFVGHGLNEVDEGWPLYAAMQIHDGASLYREAFFVFPPGHVLPAWIAYGIDPPGVVLTRAIYAGFTVALVAALYVLGCRLMPAPFALLGAAMCAVATPDSHLKHLLFGYRYLVWSVLALLAFDARLERGNARWLMGSGLFTGMALLFRLTPGVAVGAGLVAGVLADHRSWRRWLPDAAWGILGLALALVPTLFWLASEVGAAGLWREIVARPIEMTTLQSKPIPDLFLPGWNWTQWPAFFAALLFRVCALTYLGYLVVLGGRWWRSLVRRERFDQPLLLAVVVWASVYFLRSLGRSDEPHLASTLPPFCLLVAHATYLGLGRLSAGRRELSGRAAWAVVAGVFALWVAVSGSQRVLDPAYLGSEPLAALDGAVRTRPGHDWVDPKIEGILAATEPEDRILVLGPQSMFHVLTGRRGPGHRDVLMPGTFRGEAEERVFLAQLERDPPAVVVRPQWPFDFQLSRSVAHTAPRVSDWVEERYELRGDGERFGLLLPRTPPARRGSDGRTDAADER